MHPLQRPTTARGGRRIPTHDTEAHPWCVEHDPTGTCLGDVRRLSRGGAAWLEGTSTTTTIVIALGRPEQGHRGQMSELTAAEARHLITTLEELVTDMTRLRH